MREGQKGTGGAGRCSRWRQAGHGAPDDQKGAGKLGGCQDKWDDFGWKGGGVTNSYGEKMYQAEISVVTNFSHAAIGFGTKNRRQRRLLKDRRNRRTEDRRTSIRLSRLAVDDFNHSVTR